jgi:hypothetical protein
MDRHTSRRDRRIRPFIASIAFVLQFSVPVVSPAAEIEREIPVAHDGRGSTVHVEISQEGARQTAIPVISVTEPTMEKVVGRLGNKVDGAVRQIGAQAPSSCPAVAPPVEVTTRTAKSVFKAVRDFLRKKQAPVPAPQIGSGFPLPERQAAAQGTAVSSTDRN